MMACPATPAPPARMRRANRLGVRTDNQSPLPGFTDYRFSVGGEGGSGSRYD